MPLPLWAIGAGAASLAGGLAYGLSQGKRNTVSNPYNVLGNSQATITAINLLNDHLQREQQRIRAEVSGDLGLTPEWTDRVAVNRSDEKYQNWLRNSQEFKLGGKRYQWKEENTGTNGDIPWEDLNNNQIAKRMSQLNHKDPGQYQGSYKNLIAEKQRLTGKRYIPVALP